MKIVTPLNTILTPISEAYHNLTLRCILSTQTSPPTNLSSLPAAYKEQNGEFSIACLSISTPLLQKQQNKNQAVNKQTLKNDLIFLHFGI
jgi:hypothetical protein